MLDVFNLHPITKRPVSVRPDERTRHIGAVGAPAAKAQCFVSAVFVSKYDVFDCRDAVGLYDVPAMACGTAQVY